MKNENWDMELEEYIKQSDPNIIERTKNWKTAIGLQDVDGLKPSNYLMENVKEHIDGKININEVEKRINEYYKVLDNRKKENMDTEEADKVSVRIARILSEKTFNFNPSELKNIHYRLFRDIYTLAGKIRTYNFIKNEWILNGDTVIYSSYEMIPSALEYDFNLEKNFSYKDLSFDDAIKH